MTFRERLFTRRTAAAITSPPAILRAGGGTAAAVLAGAPLALAAAVGVVGWAGWVAWRMPRAVPDPTADVDPRRLRDPWRWDVKEAQDARRRYAAAVAGVRSGPLRDRLAEIGERVGDGVAECWRIARHGQDLEEALARLVPVEQVQQRLGTLDRQPSSPTNERLRAALRAQVDTYRRIEQIAADARERLQVLEVRLDEAVARAVELSLRIDDPVELGGLGDDVDRLVGEMEALRRGIEETAGQTAIR